MVKCTYSKLTSKTCVAFDSRGFLNPNFLNAPTQELQKICLLIYSITSLINHIALLRE